MAKYSKKIVERICSLISEDSFTVAEICAKAGIAISTYYEWQESKAEFSEAIKRSKDKFDETLVKEAKASLRKLVNGYEFDEKKTIYTTDKDGKPKIKEQTTIKKHYQPSVPAVIFTLANKASDEYKNRQSSEITGKDGKDLFSGLTDDQLQERINELEQKLKS
jgi:hypothetical protein